MSRHVFTTEIGLCAIAWEDARLTGFSLPNPKLGLEENAGAAPGWIERLLAQVQLHVTGHAQDFAAAPFHFERVTEFQREVYIQTLGVKSGRTRSYGELASALGLAPGGARAVAAALAANPWPLLVPCHRVIGTNGNMTGFSGPGGIVTKTRLLALEGAQLL